MAKKKTDERVSREVIKRDVVATLRSVTQEEEVKESHKLRADLGMRKVLRQAMAVPYTKISKRHDGRTIGPTRAGRLKTVEASINLVHKRANA